jgi:serine/threonine protein kinase
MENPHDGTMLIKKSTLREELQRLSDPSVSPDLLDFIEFLLVVDHSKRPTSSEALQHPYLQSLSKCKPGEMKISSPDYQALVVTAAFMKSYLFQSYCTRSHNLGWL